MPPKRKAMASAKNASSEGIAKKKSKVAGSSKVSDDQTEETAASSSKQPKRAAKTEAQKKDSGEWTAHGSPAKAGGVAPLLFRLDKNRSQSGCKEIYGFDIDDTIITPKSGAKFATSATDWKFVFTVIPDTLKALHDKGVKVVFFTNQAGIEKGNSDATVLMRKFDDVIATIGIPIDVYVSTGHSHFRKPSTAMWDVMADDHNNGVKPDLTKCVFVGDAAGRPKDWTPGAKKDFSCSDRQLAANVGCQFKTPEEFFLKETSFQKFSWGSFNPKTASSLFKAPYEKSYHKSPAGCELVVLCGPPASGKSTFFRRFFEPHGYVHVNRDTLSTEAKCMKVAEESLSEGHPVVIDNTNPAPQTRVQFISMAKKYGAAIRCIILDTPLEVAKHLNFVRQNDTAGKIRRIPDVGYNVYKSKFQEPSTSEGFQEVIRVPFYPVFDKLTAKESLFNQWTEG
ncbi:uncharacterized protein F21D5.5-like isoform X2 [Convolutriloba macropyga]|uniref:uncharacterized protein F21D5.5-like isoform X2 n=1 Tax=Convolutriloba macropyga TaxID=536237 RepID=UPI003F51AC92